MSDWGTLCENCGGSGRVRNIAQHRGCFGAKEPSLVRTKATRSAPCYACDGIGFIDQAIKVSAAIDRKAALKLAEERLNTIMRFRHRIG